MNNLAEMLSAQGDDVAARQLQGQVLGSRRRVLGVEHPDSLTATLNFAGTLRVAGRSELTTQSRSDIVGFRL